MYTILCFLVATVYVSGNKTTDQKFEALFNEIERLKAKVANHETQLEGLKSDFATRERNLLAEISALKTRCQAGCGPEVVNNRSSRRSLSRTPVAFYALAPNYDFSNMGAQTNLIYGEPITNVGNAFHNSTGTFIAPVRGVYVIHVTIGGNIHNSNYFYVDVSGTQLANVLLTSEGPTQSSQTVVVLLKPGDHVTVKAGKDNAGAYGLFFTSIGGFLLYEDFFGAPVGK